MSWNIIRDDYNTVALLRLPLSLKREPTRAAAGMSLSGNVFFFAGNLATLGVFCAAQATAAGAAISEGATAKTTHLVAGPGAEDEVAAAAAAGVTVMSEAEFFRVLCGGSGGGEAAAKGRNKSEGGGKNAKEGKGEAAENAAVRTPPSLSPPPPEYCSFLLVSLSSY
jgi:BRCT domain type II-containing protein